MSDNAGGALPHENQDQDQVAQADGVASDDDVFVDAGDGSHADEDHVAAEVDPQFQLGFRVFSYLNSKMELDVNSTEYDEVSRVANQMLASLRHMKDIMGAGPENGLSIIMEFLNSLLKDLNEMQDENLILDARVRALSKIMILGHELNISVRGTDPGCDSDNCIGANTYCLSSCKDKTRFCLFCSDWKEDLKCPVENCQWIGDLTLPKGGLLQQAIRYIEGSSQRRESADLLDKGQHLAEALKKMIQSYDNDKMYFTDQIRALDLVKSLKPFIDSQGINEGSLFKILIELLSKRGNMEKANLTKKILEELLFVSRAIDEIDHEISEVGKFRCASKQCLAKTRIVVTTNCQHVSKFCVYCLQLQPELKCHVMHCSWKRRDGLL